MKPSGIPWLGDVPEGWSARKIGSLYAPRNGKVSDSEFPPLSVTKQGILPQLEHVAKSNDRDNRKLVRVNDFVINSRSDRRGSCGISKQDGSVSLINIVLQPLGKMEPQYFDWLFHTVAFADEFYKWGQGIDDDVWSTHWTSMKKIVVPFPPLPEQQAIAERIDCEVARVDALREKIKREIERLGDYKKSLIAETVTRGLRKRKMKPSGIPWLGDVPVEWEVTRIGYLATRKPPKYSPEEELLSVFLDRGVIRFADGGSKRANVASGDFSKYQLVEPGDFVLNNQQAWRGSVGVSTYRGIISPAYLILKTKSVVDAVYANYLFRSRPLVALYEQCSHGVGSIQRNIYWDELRVQKIPVPSLPEQREIAEYLDRVVLKIDAVVARRKAQLEKLEAFKRSLIQEYVTGKREVCQ